ncbi:hypothetical protein JX265_013733 [Neoarthrinium moseri]|uniref:Zn(2)-C6 fungal-type domain-containing protein n=1 Tax=Neoarthrinium moseri TaxID=1658444 RepID=A0A9P9W853_9PEZI|nr:hypothetical protein JX266_011371 [Neoarthrinium moseri]KAI1848990.1 hypothetical protein JX265_013733 [Neoarthrinium moseri]
MADPRQSIRDRAIRRVRRACDACRRRRVKCNGNPECCQQCSHLNLRCVYSTDARSSSRNGVARGSVISALRDISSPTATATTARSSNNATSSRILGHGERITLGGQTKETSPKIQAAAMFSKEFFKGLLSDYTLHVYVVNPIISPLEMAESIERMDQPENLVDNALVHAYAAVTLNLTTPNWQADQAESLRIHQLLGLALSARDTLVTRSMSIIESSIHPHLTARLIMTAIFIEICLMAVDKFSEAFMILREAIAMIQLLGVDRLVAEDPPNQAAPGQTLTSTSRLPPEERSRRIRMYWEAFIHERFLTIVAYYPAALAPLPPEVSLPTEDPSIPQNVQTGWRYLVRLFCVVDDDFIRYWRSIGSAPPRGVTAEWIETKMHHLDDLSHMDLEMYQDTRYHNLQDASGTSSFQVLGEEPVEPDCLSTLQKADIIVTRQWLLMVLWQLAISSFPLTSQSIRTRSAAMSLQFPARLSQQLRQVVVILGRKNIERHGSGILKKLFEITNALGDVIIHVPTDSTDHRSQWLDDFNFLFDFLHNSASLSEVQVNILAEKSIAATACVRREQRLRS